MENALSDLRRARDRRGVTIVTEMIQVNSGEDDYESSGEDDYESERAWFHACISTVMGADHHSHHFGMTVELRTTKPAHGAERTVQVMLDYDELQHILDMLNAYPSIVEAMNRDQRERSIVQLTTKEGLGVQLDADVGGIAIGVNLGEVDPVYCYYDSDKIRGVVDFIEKAKSLLEARGALPG